MITNPGAFELIAPPEVGDIDLRANYDEQTFSEVGQPPNSNETASQVSYESLFILGVGAVIVACAFRRIKKAHTLGYKIRTPIELTLTDS